MKTIFITIHDGEIAKNIFRTDAWKLLKNAPGIRFVLLVPLTKRDYYENQFGGENVVVEILEGFKLSAIQRVAHTFFVHALPVTTESINSAYLIAKSKRAVFKYAAFKAIYLFSHFAFFRKMFQRIGGLFLPRRSLDSLFDKYEPYLVFAANILAYEDANLIREAKRKMVPALSMVKSWDTSSSKRLFRALPDYLIVLNTMSKEDAVNLHNLKKETVFVAGFSHYDMYFRREGIVPKEEFFSSMGLDLKKKLIFYCAIGEWLFPEEHEIIEILDKAIDSGKISFAAQVIARPHPKYEGIDKKLGKRSNVIVDRGATYHTSKVEEWEFEKEDIHHLINSIAHCDVLVTTASTMTIEGCIFNKPVINIAFDGYKKKKGALSVSRYYNQHHYKPITESGGVRLVKNEEELVHSLNEYFSNPDLDAEGRSVVKNEQCVWLDGKSGERIAQYILKILNK